MRGTKAGSRPPAARLGETPIVVLYVGACTRAGEGSNLDQVLSRLSNQCELRCTSRRAISWTCLALLDFPDPAGVGVDRGPVLSLRAVLFLLF